MAQQFEGYGLQGEALETPEPQKEARLSVQQDPESSHPLDASPSQFKPILKGFNQVLDKSPSYKNNVSWQDLEGGELATVYEYEPRCGSI